MARVHWRDIEQACEAAGLPIEAWVRGLHDRLVTDIITRTNSAQQYLTDAQFHNHMELFIAIVIATICEHDPLSEDLRHRAVDLGNVFRDEIREAFGGEHGRT